MLNDDDGYNNVFIGDISLAVLRETTVTLDQTCLWDEDNEPD